MQVVENILYVQSEPSYLRLDHDTVVIEREGSPKRSLPLLAFGGIVLFGDIMVSPALIRRCSEDGRTITFLDRNGRFRARVEGPVSGNVLLRRSQYETLVKEEMSLKLGRAFVAGKLQNARYSLLRSARETDNRSDEDRLRFAADKLAVALKSLPGGVNLDEVRGIEGEAARTCFQVFKYQVRVNRDEFGITGRTRRPPLDRMNALLSFLYTLLTHDCRSALEGVGLDPQVGYLHTLRPGRPALALDLMEEFRPILGDRLSLTLVNRKQVVPEDFIERKGGAVQFSDEARKKVIIAYVERKQQEVSHPLSKKKVTIALIPHLQARLLARVLRGDLDSYVPYLYK